MNEIKVFHYKELAILYRENTVDIDVLNHSFDVDIFYKAVKNYQASENNLVIDVGGHIGTFSLFSIVDKKAGKVISLEPNTESFDLLVKNVKNNNLGKEIKTLSYALSNYNGEAKLFLDNENWGHSLTHSGLANFEIVKTITLDFLFQQEKINSCDLIKLNCEGAEFQIILSLQKHVLSKVKMMIILFHEDLVKDANRNDIVNHLKKNSFRVRLLNLTEDRGWIIAANRSTYDALSYYYFIGQERLRSMYLQARRKISKHILQWRKK